KRPHFWLFIERGSTVNSALFRGGAVVNALLENRRRLEHHNASWRDWHFFPRFGVPANTLALFPHNKRAKRRQFHGFATLKAVGNLLEYQLNQSSRFRA